ncbi:protein Skeletor, isoforms B/C-like isoform X1 [Diadema setosum]|uniref:protein Skeletor, isoforms B/C-like isoform X1 n=1 Tax=Diadema setosum TaxID=31175 RepID=UPI003B3AF90B
MAWLQRVPVWLHLFLYLYLQAAGQVSGQYNGKLVASFGTSNAHAVTGTVYAIDNNRLRIIGFSYDGTAPDAFLWGGRTGIPSDQGFIIPDETGSLVKLGPYDNRDIDVQMPAGQTVSDLAWLSVWCRRFAVDFAHVSFPANFVPPSEYNLGPLGYSPRVHNVYASSVTILNPKQIRFKNLYYDGYGPRAYFWAGPGGTPSNANGIIVPDETGSKAVLGQYSDATLTITLPDAVTVFDIGHIGLWCVLANQDFGHLDIPAQNQLNIPPEPLAQPMPRPTTPSVSSQTLSVSSQTRSVSPQTQPMDEFPNCETLSPGNLQVRWKINGTDITIRLSSRNSPGEYAAFGVSGSATGTRMVGGDVTVAYVEGETGQARVVDYYLSAYAQCTPQNGAGACPDLIAAGAGSATDDVTLLSSVTVDGITHITYTRPLAAQDSTYDKPILTNGPTFVIWALGPINADGRVAYHNQKRSPRESNLQIEFGRASSTCEDLNAGRTTPPMSDGWEIESLVALEDTTFTVEMGLSGGEKGYEAITGQVGWGIAWFIDDLLIPELTVKRGSTYTFLVRGGDDPSVNANYHPFYITDDPNGGFEQLINDNTGVVSTIFAGPEEGPLCQWMNTPTTGNADDYSSFGAYRSTLVKNCQPGEPGKLVWKVAMDTPDLVYYQCYTHRFLGWKIHVTGRASPVSASICSIIILSILSLINM